MTLDNRIIAGAILAGIIALLMLGAGIERLGHRCPVCPTAPEIVTRSHSVRDSIFIHDTVRVVKYAPSIAVIAEQSRDTTQGEIIAYEVIDTMPDRAIVGFSIASRELPDRYLPDLTHTAWYLAAPERIRIISDTLTVQLPALKPPSRIWREVKIGGICIGVGAVAATSIIIWRGL